MILKIPDINPNQLQIGNQAAEERVKGERNKHDFCPKLAPQFYLILFSDIPLF